MTLATTLLAAYCAALVVMWLIAMLRPRVGHRLAAITFAVMLMLPGIAVIIDAPFYWLGDFGEKDLGFPLIAMPAFALSVIALTLSLIQRARRQPFGF